MPPVLDPSKSKVDGLAFLGLSLTRHSAVGHPDSITHQEAFDLNEVQDRDYEYIFSTNDDGWLVGGGEPGPPSSYKLAAKDTAHVEIIRIGTYRPEWGGVAQQDIIDAMESGKILIPQIEALPTAVVANPDLPPELEIRFDMEPAVPNFDDPSAPLPINWQLRFLHNQLFRHFQFPSRFCPGPFHSTILRKAEFRSPEHRVQYFEKCEAAIQRWRQDGPRALNTGWAVDGTRLENAPEYTSGIFLFLDRQNITHSFMPNFLPPYDTPEKRQIILNVLKEEWDEKTLTWNAVVTATTDGAIEVFAEEIASIEQKSETQVKDVPDVGDDMDACQSDDTDNYDVVMAPTDEWDAKKEDVSQPRNENLTLQEEEEDEYMSDEEATEGIDTRAKTVLEVPQGIQSVLECQEHEEAALNVPEDSVAQESESLSAGSCIEVKEAETNLDGKDVKEDASQLKNDIVEESSTTQDEIVIKNDDGEQAEAFTQQKKEQELPKATLEEDTSTFQDDAGEKVDESQVVDKSMTDAPVTDAPVTDAPVTDAPVTDAPVTDAPVTDAPVTDAPAKDAPAKDAPAKDALAKEHVIQEDVVRDEPTKEAPVLGENPKDGAITTKEEVKPTKHVEEKKDDEIIEDSEGHKDSVAASFESGVFQSACCGMGMSLGY